MIRALFVCLAIIPTVALAQTPESDVLSKRLLKEISTGVQCEVQEVSLRKELEKARKELESALAELKAIKEKK